MELVSKGFAFLESTLASTQSHLSSTAHTLTSSINVDDAQAAAWSFTKSVVGALSRPITQTLAVAESLTAPSEDKPQAQFIVLCDISLLMKGSEEEVMEGLKKGVEDVAVCEDVTSVLSQ